MTKTRREWLTVDEAAKIASIHIWTMYRRIKAGQIPHSRDGRRMLIHSADLKRYVEGRKVPASERQAKGVAR